MGRPRGLRVIAGSAKGRRLDVPGGASVRPTLERIREALFSIVGNNVEGAMVLDLFAGSGALGIEALSRGARQAVFADEDPACIRTIRTNVERCGFSGRSIVLEVPIPEGLDRIREAVPGPYDLVFLDPPYGLHGQEDLLGMLLEFSLPAEHGTIVFQHGRKRVHCRVPEGLDVNAQRRYGDTVLTLLKMKRGTRGGHG